MLACQPAVAWAPHSPAEWLAHKYLCLVHAVSCIDADWHLYSITTGLGVPDIAVQMLIAAYAHECSCSCSRHARLPAMRATLLGATHTTQAYAAVQSIHARSAAQHKRTSNLMPCLRFWNVARTAGILLHRQEGSHCPYCAASDSVYTTVHNANRELDRIALIKVASKLTGLQRQLDIARSTDAGDNSLTSWQEALLLGLVGASYEAHELTHRVAVVVWRPEGMLCNSPPWREDHKVCHRRACTSGVAVLSAAAAAAAADWQKQ